MSLCRYLQLAASFSLAMLDEYNSSSSSSSSSSSFSVQGSVFSRIDALLGEFRVGGGVHDS